MTYLILMMPKIVRIIFLFILLALLMPGSGPAQLCCNNKQLNNNYEILCKTCNATIFLHHGPLSSFKFVDLYFECNIIFNLVIDNSSWRVDSDLYNCEVLSD